jgi:hypothetical protein
VGDGYKIPWEMREQIRNNKTCGTCRYGAELSGNSAVPLCSYYFWEENEKHPKLAPSINTCPKWAEPRDTGVRDFSGEKIRSTICLSQ